MLGYPDAAFADAEHALEDARESGHAVTLMLPLMFGGLTKIVRGNYGAANAFGEELVALADQKQAPIYQAPGMKYTRLRVGAD
jgi:hypothetical protein